MFKIPIWKNKNLKEWLNSFNPDVVFAVLGGDEYINTVALFVSDYLKIPLVVFYTDDYLLHPVRKGILEKLVFRRMNYLYEKIISRSQLCFCIGQQMAEEYSSYFHKNFLPIMNSIAIQPFQSQEMRNSRPIISYFGGLHLNRWKMIGRLASILSDLAVVKVYTSSEITQEIKVVMDMPNVELCGFVDSKSIKGKMLESDFLLHVESDEELYRSLTCLSVSTKIPEYLVTGKVVVAYGPPEVASMRILSDNGIGLTFSSDEEPNIIRKRIADIISDREKRREMVKKAYDYAAEQFDKEKNASFFREKIITCSIDR